MYGEGGDDSLTLGSGDDQAYGGLGRDSIAGGDGHDFIVGGMQDDRISGGPGSDVLWGGVEAIRFEDFSRSSTAFDFATNFSGASWSSNVGMEPIVPILLGGLSVEGTDGDEKIPSAATEGTIGFSEELPRMN